MEGESMRLDELLKKLRAEGVSPDLVRIMDWRSAKLIPQNEQDGDKLEWPDYAWWEAVAAAYLLDTRGWSEPEVRIGRFYMEPVLLSGESPVVKLDWLRKGEGENYDDAFEWTVTCIKAQKGWPLYAPAFIIVHRRQGETALEYELVESLEDTLREDGMPGVHPQYLSLDDSDE
jgi:hypothetical protein